MKEELELQLVKKYPNIFKYYKGDPRKTCMAWGMTCGDGWYDVLDQACEKLSKYEGVVADQVKEKMGGLRFYISVEKEYPKKTYEKIFKIAEDAERKASKVCEKCGGHNDRTQVYRGWIYGLCKVCFEEMKERRSGDVKST